MPNTYENTFRDLYKHGFMTPTYLSSLIMNAVLPAKFCVEKHNDLWNDGKTRTYLSTGHTLTSFLVNGIETFEILAPRANQAYQINFCGNGQDARAIAEWRTYSTLDKNMIYWNYPNVGLSAGQAQSVHDLIDAGYQQVKRLLDEKHIPANEITLHGLSLGGGVAAQVAQRLHKEGHVVHLEIDRSFSSLAAAITEILKAQGHNGPLSTSVIAFSISGLTLGVMTAGLIASIGLAVASRTPAAIAPYIDTTINILGSIIGASIALAGLIIGAAVGCALGTLLSLQYFWTDELLTLPMMPAFSALLNAACCELNSVDAVRHLNPSANIQIINSMGDEVIHVPASLNVGLGFEPGKAPREDENSAFKPNIHSIWYRYGRHNDPLEKLSDPVPMP